MSDIVMTGEKSVASPDDLQRGLKNRHLQMIALGGAIGTGLFYGSASTIALAGPSVCLAYLLGGAMIFLIMRMLGEMAVAEPVCGSFSYFAAKYWGDFPGFLSGWNYWFLYIFVSMAELTAAGIYMDFWLPDLPHWLTALVLIVAITAVNLINVRMYGETEFFLSMIKISAICGMIILGLYLIFSSAQPFPDNVSNLWRHGGFFPNGVWGMFLSLAVVLFSFGGIELIGVTAGEASDPEHTIPRAINQIIWRILIFYVGTMVVLMALWPWNQVGKEASPLVQIFAGVGIPAAAHILNFVVMVAAISVYNSAIYSNSRMLYGLSKDGSAPKFFATVSNSGVPVRAILFSSGITLLTVVLNYFFPEEVFMYLLSIVTGAVITTWTMIALTHFKFRAAYENRHRPLKFRSLFFPWANYLCLAFFLAVFGIMLTMPEMRQAVFVLPVWLAALWCGYKYKTRQ